MRHLFILLALMPHLVARAQADCDSLLRAQQMQLEELVAKVKHAQYDLDKARKESEVLRGLMKGYVVTIDSLSQVVRQLHAQDPIERRLQSCLDKSENFSKAGMRGCVADAMDAWEAEMTAVYEALMGGLSPVGRDALHKAQQAWLEYREAAHQQFGQFYYEEKQGTMYHVSASLHIKDLVMQRVIELRAMQAMMLEK